MPTLEQYRQEEYAHVAKFFHEGVQVLEIGGGSGFQASLIAATGATVESIDVEVQPQGRTFFPVRIYDGRKFPFADGVFDLVFSSNVLEHIKDLEDLLSESRRVTKDNGLAIHILPTPA